ncbi:UpxY family transcription antiterminator [Bacteroidota bacterium]
MTIIDEKYRWFAVYTKYLHEKKIHKHLTELNIKSYVPLEKKLRIWADRKKWIESPLFPCYVFVFVSNKEYYNILNHPSVLRYVCFNGSPEMIPEKQINTVRTILNSGLNYSLNNVKYKSGDQIKIRYGPLKNCCGEIINSSGDNELLIIIDKIGYSLKVKLPTIYV